MMHAWGNKCRSPSSKPIRLDINTPYNVMAEKGSSINNPIMVKMSGPFFAGFHLCKSGTRRAHNIVGFNEGNDIFLDLRCWKLVIPKKLCLTGHTDVSPHFHVTFSGPYKCSAAVPRNIFGPQKCSAAASRNIFGPQNVPRRLRVTFSGLKMFRGGSA